MNKLFGISLLAALCTAGITAGDTGIALAQSSAEADAHNDAGKALFKERRYLEAYRRFKQAVAISPEGRFYFNVCFSLNYLERFQEAIEACEQVEPNGAEASLLNKTNAVLDALRAKVPAPTPPPVDPNAGVPPVDPNTGQPIDPNAGGNPVDPNTGQPIDPNTGQPIDPNAGGTPVDPNTGQPIDPNAGNPPPPSTGPATIPGLDPFAAKKASGEYAWALGATLSPLLNLGIGSGGGDSFYAPAGFGINMFANFMYRAEQQIGLQGYIGIANIPPEDEEFFDPLNIFDFGGAVYKHIDINEKISVTPLVGLHVSLMQPDPSFEEGLVAVGLRLQSSIDYHLGAKKQHVFSFSPGLNLYSGASSSSVLPAEAFGLESGGATLEIGLSYQFRFTDAFGSGPLFTLE